MAPSKKKSKPSRPKGRNRKPKNKATSKKSSKKPPRKVRQSSKQTKPRSSKSASKSKSSKKKAHKSDRSKRKRDSAPTLFWKLRQALPTLEGVSYYELDKKTQALLENFEDDKGIVPRIEAWTFKLHPAVVDAFVGGSGRLKRFILTIDTLRSAIYNPVKEFLESRTANITSYYTGGWADFLCDIQMEQNQFDEFIQELRSVLRPGIEKLLGQGKVDNVITYFEAFDPIMLCGKPLRKMLTPSDETIDALLADRVRFETVHRDYRSKPSLDLFDRNEKRLREYLAKLKSDGVIVCYDIVFDFSFGIARDYVPMILASDQEGPINKILDDAKKEPALIRPVREWLKVRPIRFGDPAEGEVNYLFINQYDFPGERTKWKQAIYNHSDIDINLYNYPLESTLNESPVYLSDLPEFINKAKLYSRGYKDRKLFFGWPSHPFLQKPPEVAFPTSGLGGQGVTLGESGSGKTNMDLVLASEACHHLKSVLVLDASGGIENKANTLPSDAAGKLKIVNVSGYNNSQFSQFLSDDNVLYFLTTTKSELPLVFEKLLTKIESSPDLTSSNEPRRVTKMLIVEEVGDALGSSPDVIENNVILLKQVLSKAYRKGWCIWLSTQRPSQLGHDDQSASDVLGLLHNRIIGKIRNRQEVDVIVKTFHDEGYSDEDLKDLPDTLRDLPIGSAIGRAVEIRDDKEHNLPLLRIKFRMLTKS